MSVAGSDRRDSAYNVEGAGDESRAALDRNVSHPRRGDDLESDTLTGITTAEIGGAKASAAAENSSAQ